MLTFRVDTYVSVEAASSWLIVEGVFEWIRIDACENLNSTRRVGQLARMIPVAHSTVVDKDTKDVSALNGVSCRGLYSTGTVVFTW